MATYYISPSGNDTTGDGSSGNPWATLAKFLSSSTTSDTCICAAGTYTWATATITSRTIQAASGATVTFSASGTTTWTITASAISDISFVNSGDSMFECNNATFTRCKFDSLTYQNDIAGSALFAMKIPDSDIDISMISCLIRNPQRNASSTWFSAIFGYRNPTSSTLSLTNCVLTVETATATTRLVGGINVGAIEFTLNSKNNIFYNSSGYAFDYSNFAGGSSPIVSGTSLTNTRYAIGSGWPSGTGNITDDPLFVDAANGNFNLRPTSPCINTGTLV